MTATDSPAVAAPPPDAASEAETRLYHSATRDSLTGLPNRHYFREAAERALLLAGRQQSPVTVLAMDVDDFDGLIAAHGQPLADAVVQRRTADRRVGKEGVRKGKYRWSPYQ